MSKKIDDDFFDRRLLQSFSLVLFKCFSDPMSSCSHTLSLPHSHVSLSLTLPSPDRWPGSAACTAISAEFWICWCINKSRKLGWKLLFFYINQLGWKLGYPDLDIQKPDIQVYPDRMGIGISVIRIFDLNFKIGSDIWFYTPLIIIHSYLFGDSNMYNQPKF